MSRMIVANAFETIFKEGRKPYKIRTDKGQEFRARAVQSVFKEAGIKHFYAQNEVKAATNIWKTRQSQLKYIRIHHFI
jgi:purine nucleoside phosphorylase